MDGARADAAVAVVTALDSESAVPRLDVGGRELLQRPGCYWKPRDLIFDQFFISLMRLRRGDAIGTPQRHAIANMLDDSEFVRLNVAAAFNLRDQLGKRGLCLAF